MTTYRTGNPVGSSDPRDLYDNAENLDSLVNGDQAAYNDRLGKSRRSWQSVEDQVNQQEAEFNASQADREGVFNAYLVSAGYQFAGDYAAGIEITQYNQVVRDTSGEFWRLSGSTALPYTTTGAGLPEGGAFVYAGDAVLRQELAASGIGKGTALIGGLSYVTVKEFGATGDGTADDTLAIQSALENSLNLDVVVPPGDYRITGITMPQNRRLEFAKGATFILTADNNAIEMAKNCHLVDPQIDCTLVDNFTKSAIYFNASALADASTRNHSTRVIRPWLWGREGAEGQMGYGIHVDSGPAPAKMYYIYVTDAYINAFDKGIYYTSDGGYLNAHTYSNLFFSGCVWDIWLESGSANTFDNIVTQPDAWRGKQGCFYIKSGYNTINNVFVYDAGSFAPGASYIELTETSANNLITVRSLSGRSVVDNGANNKIVFDGPSGITVNKKREFEGVQNVDIYSHNVLLYSDSFNSVVQTSGPAPSSGSLASLFMPGRVTRWQSPVDPVVIEITLASTFNNALAIGCRMTVIRRAEGVKIETFRDGAWEVWEDISDESTGYVLSTALNYTPFSNGIEKIRYTFTGPLAATDSIEVRDLFALTAEENENHFLPRGGGDVWGRTTFHDRLFVKERLCITDQQPATTLGTVKARMAIYDSTGAFIGHIPIYDSISQE